MSSARTEGRSSFTASLVLLGLYRLTRRQRVRAFLRRLVLRLEGGPVYSQTIREIYREFHGVDVGLYTIGPCDVDPGNLAPGTSVGRYSSIYYTVRTLASEHPLGDESLQGLFCVSALHPARSDSPKSRLVIGNDVWMGHNVIVLPSVERIGDGAVIGAGSVVHANVPPYAVVAGNPARVVRYRFSDGKIRELMGSKWWLKTIDEMSAEIADFRKPLEAGTPSPQA